LSLFFKGDQMEKGLPITAKQSTRRLITILAAVIGASMAIAAAWYFKSAADDHPSVARSPVDSPKPNIQRTFVKPDRDSALALIPPRLGVSDIQNTQSLILLTEDVVVAAQAIRPALPDPILIARSTSPSDPQLTDWLVRWRANLAAGRFTDEQNRTELESIVRVSQLSFPTLLKIGQSMQDLANDSVTTAIVYSAAIAGADYQLQRYKPGEDPAKSILVAMNDSRRLFWDAADFHQDRRSMETLKVINADLARWIKPGDPDLEDARRHAIIGIPECMFVMGDAHGAVPLLMAIDISSMTENEKLGVAWIRGLALFEDSQFEECLPQFQIVMDDSSYQYSKAACHYLFCALMATNRFSEAQGVSDLYSKRYGLDGETSYFSGLLTARETADSAILESQ
jgi:hypothetical protein